MMKRSEKYPYRETAGGKRPDDWLNIGEAAEFVGMSRAQFRPFKLTIPHQNYEGRIIYHKMDLEAFLERHRVEPLSDIPQPVDRG